MLGHWGQVTNPYWDEPESAEFRLMEDYGLKLSEYVLDSATWTK
jgi:hypothetical protein